MKTRNYKNGGLQAMYDLFRHQHTGNKYAGSAAAGAYQRGLAGHPDRNVPTSLSQAAWAAGADTRHDAIRDREIHNELDGSAVFDASIEDLY